MIKIIFLIILLILIEIYYINDHKTIPNLNNYLNNFKFQNKFKYHLGTQKYGVDMIYCIVLPKRKDYMLNVMKNVNCFFFDAITPDDLTHEDYTILSSTFEYSPFSEIYKKKTRLALQLSHVMCYLHAIKNNLETIIIFEDDILPKDLSSLPQAIEQFKTSRFKIFYLGYCQLNCKRKYKKENYLIPVNNWILCMHAIAYKVKYLPDIINNLFYMKQPIDQLLRKFIQKNKDTACISEHAYFDQNDELGTNLEYNSSGIKTDNTNSCNQLNLI